MFLARVASLAVVGMVLVLVSAGSAWARPEPPEPFQIVPGSFHLEPSTLQAGAHADWTLTFDLAHDAQGHTYNDLRSTTVNYPAGFVGNNLAVPTCSITQLLAQGPPQASGTLCPQGSQVGVISLDLTIHTKPVRETFPVYNMEVTTFGIAAQLGFKTAILTQLLAVTVRPAESGLTGASPNVKELAEPRNVKLTLWGVPAAHEHDAQRDLVCEEFSKVNEAQCEGGNTQAGIPEKPFIGNPTGCGMRAESMEASSWEEPFAAPSFAAAEVGPFVECERLHFEPSIQVTPTTGFAESSSGLDVTLEVPQTWDIPNVLATANLKDTTVALPVGYTINPSAGNGLAGCTPAQYAAETASSAPGAGCPPESKLGKVDIETPLLTEHIKGSVFLATPYENVASFDDESHPGGSLLALYVVAKAPDRGIVVKSAGKVELDPLTGQLVTTFKETPQQPFTRFTLEFSQGATSPLVSPPTCGPFLTHAALTPWSAPSEPRQLTETSQIEHGVGGGPCPSGGTPPFHPQAITGTQNNAAGSYSPFYLHLLRRDGEQELTRFSTTMPPGLTGNLTGIPFCPDAAIQTAKERTGTHGGGEELAAPSCPAASKIGHTVVEAGVGSVLAQTPGTLYLAGPYHGAPLSLVSVTSAVVGPFDLGTVVIRFALRINPLTAQVEVDATGSDPIPHIIKGIVTHVRDIRAYIDRPAFIKNPTSCERLQIQNQVAGANGATASLTSPFQAADCQSLAFKPSFKAQVTGRATKQNGAGLKVNIAYPNTPQGTEANIHAVKVELPIQLPSRLTTLQKACTAAQFRTNPAGCPAASVVGHARAITPILPVPLEGPAYFVSNGGEAFPNLIIVLQGYGVTIDLVGDTFISKQGITSSTFKTVPDQPVTSFELTLPQGPYSALTANGNLCALTRTVLVKKRVTVSTRGRKRTITRRVKQTLPASLSMPTEFVAQNGMTLHQNTPVGVTGCPKIVKMATKAKKRSRHHR